MIVLVIAHFAVALALPLLARRSTRAAFLVAALPPLAALGWVLAEHAPVLAGSGPARTVSWAPLIGLDFSFRLDSLALLMTLLVSGVGALVLLYSRTYFEAGSGAAKRSAPLLLSFAGAMLGLVLADELVTVYVFWELTTICSFLLVGQAGISRESRRSALQALMITAFGGLVMLLGFVLLGDAAGTYRISELIEHPPAGPQVGAAAVLVLVGAFTKSAQMPFHNWLPAAMVAPTPISAYLHAASMVKAGVFLVARLEPVFLGVAHWKTLAIVFGLVTMLVAGWRSLHENDLKKLLAYGTVSQLGFMMVLVGAGTRTAAMAGAAMLLAHGMFKASLFLTVGIVDHQTGTRDLRELSGLGRRLPWLAGTATVAAASMAGVPPMLGFVGKEAAFGAFLEGGANYLLVDLGLVLGSALTAAYSARFVWGAFAAKPGVAQVEAPSPSGWLFVPAAVPAAVGVVLGIGHTFTDDLAAGYARVFESGGDPYHLDLWHGFNLPLLGSVIALGLGLLLHLQRERLTAWRARLPKIADAQRGYERVMALLERTAVGVTGRVQVGSLPTYIGIILLTVLAVPGSALVTGMRPPEQLRLLDNPLQVPLAVLILVAALAVLGSRRRLTAVLMVGVVGYGIGGMFIVDGAPDLALAQFLVETLTLIAFVFVLRRLPVRFTQGEGTRALRVPKMIVAAAGGLFIAVAAVVFSGARGAPQVASQEYFARAVPETGAHNVVNAIIVDFRAFDTVGEISVLAVAATGVASLILTARFERRRRLMEQRRAASAKPEPGAPGGGSGSGGSGEGRTAGGPTLHRPDLGDREVRE